MGYKEVKTYLNSGNVIFSSDENDIESAIKQIAMMIKNQFGLDIPVFVIVKTFSQKDYQKTNWWSKTASASISNKLTIRTANTIRKIVGM